MTDKLSEVKKRMISGNKKKFVLLSGRATGKVEYERYLRALQNAARNKRYENND